MYVHDIGFNPYLIANKFCKPVIRIENMITFEESKGVVFAPVAQIRSLPGPSCLFQAYVKFSTAN